MVENDVKSLKPSPDETLKRRRLIKKLMLERGITNREEIRRILENEDGIKVSRQTIYSDIKHVASVSDEELSEFKLDIISILKKNIRDLQDMIDKTDNHKDKVYFMKSLSQLCKDEVQLASSLASGKVTSDKKKEGVNVSFV